MRFLILCLILISPVLSQSWGFFAHQKINRLAVFTLPPEMMVFYKQNIQYITENAIKPDMRRYAVKAEAARHYIDVDIYGDSAVYKMPRYWKDAVEKYTEDTLQAYGIVPYHINRMSFWLIKAFQDKNAEQILRLSSDMGHYIADANVPLHTTENYNGQLSGQYGIHGFWESRLPELFSDNYDLLSGKAEYVENLQLYAWSAVVNAHAALDSVLLFEKQITKKYPESKKYGYEERGNSTIRTYTYDFSSDYHRKLNGMVERRMRASVKMIGDFWFSCWVKAGQPDLGELLIDAEIQDSTFVVDTKVKVRNHESGIGNN
ncbi:MAG: zinc dependent phospholipase C family protein [Ekhidna sp.]